MRSHHGPPMFCSMNHWRVLIQSPLATSAILFAPQDRGIGVLITDHNVRETLDIVDRPYISMISVLMEGPPSAIVDHEDVRRVYLGDRFLFRALPSRVVELRAILRLSEV